MLSLHGYLYCQKKGVVVRFNPVSLLVLVACCIARWLCPRLLFPRRSLGVLQWMVYSRDHSGKGIVDEKGSGLHPSIIQTLQYCCSRLGTLSQPSQSPWELKYVLCFMSYNCHASGLTTAFTVLRLIERFGLEGTFKGPPPLPWAGTPSTRPRCSKSHPTWPWTLPRRGRPQLLWATWSSASPLSE